VTGSSPYSCFSDSAVCVVGHPFGKNSASQISLDPRTGRPVTKPTGAPSTELNLGADYVASDTEDGRTVWSQPIAKIFGGLQVSPNYGWRFAKGSGLYVISLGYVDRPFKNLSKGQRHVRALDRLAATAAVDAKTGATLWVRANAQPFCGGVDFDIRYPVFCLMTGTETFTGGVDRPAFKTSTSSCRGSMRVLVGRRGVGPLEPLGGWRSRTQVFSAEMTGHTSFEWDNDIAS
jgi:hypothetical protein